VYQARLIKKLHKLFPGCIVLKNDTEYKQGFPDLTILYHTMWAVLEVKADEDSPIRPNQNYYVEKLNEMSFAAFIYPQNEEAVLHELQQAFEPRRPSRVSLPQ
jgi:hypothetical protein